MLSLGDGRCTALKHSAGEQEGCCEGKGRPGEQSQRKELQDGRGAGGHPAAEKGMPEGVAPERSTHSPTGAALHPYYTHKEPKSSGEGK